MNAKTTKISSATKKVEISREMTCLHYLDQRGHLNRKLWFGDCHLLA